MTTPLRDDPDRDALPRGTEHLLVRVGAERFALPLAAVLEAVAEPTLRTVPGLPAGCTGLLAWRGRQLATYCPGASLAQRCARPVGAVLVLSAGLGLAVDEVLDVAPFAPAAVRLVPALRDPHRVVRGVAWWGGTPVTVLDPATLAAALPGDARRLAPADAAAAAAA